MRMSWFVASITYVGLTATHSSGGSQAHAAASSIPAKCGFVGNVDTTRGVIPLSDPVRTEVFAEETREGTRGRPMLWPARGDRRARWASVGGRNVLLFVAAAAPVVLPRT